MAKKVENPEFPHLCVIYNRPRPRPNSSSTPASCSKTWTTKRAVPAKRVDRSNLLEAYEDVYHTEAPDAIKEALEK